ncbi:hypothetical protein DFH09DRAFT_1376430 [Mycena vulgaris]|nr:hypothetical protein DFH09DRAFT_1376430 [Mycena vulgaris]
MPSAGKGGVSLHSRLLHLQPFPPTRASASLACNAGVKGIMRKVATSTPRSKPRTTTTNTRSHARRRASCGEAMRIGSPGAEKKRIDWGALGFLMRESDRVTRDERDAVYILGVNFALAFYPIDIATVAILMCVLLCSCSHIPCYVPLVASILFTVFRLLASFLLPVLTMSHIPYPVACCAGCAFAHLPRCYAHLLAMSGASPTRRPRPVLVTMHSSCRVPVLALALLCFRDRAGCLLRPSLGHSFLLRCSSFPPSFFSLFLPFLLLAVHALLPSRAGSGFHLPISYVCVLFPFPLLVWFLFPPSLEGGGGDGDGDRACSPEAQMPGSDTYLWGSSAVDGRSGQ